jgi:outer membrane receptor protein involved in Fe transport
LVFDIQNDHQFRAVLLGLRHNTDLAVTQEVSGTGVNDYARRRTRTEWVERDMLVGQLKGTHRLGGTKEKPLSLDWRAGRSQAQRNSPDMKEYTYRKIGPQDPFRIDPEVSGNLRTYNELQDQSDEWGLDLTVPFEVQKVGSIQWKLGFSDIRRVRDADTFRLQFIKDYLAGEEPDLTRSPDEIFADQTKWRLVNQTQSADSYRGQSSIQAFATSALWQPSSAWEGSVGYRLEEATNDVATFFYFNPDDIQSRGTNTARNLLPSYSLVWKPNDSIRARLAYGESVARPDFRELSTVRYIDNETGFEAKGNTELLPTVIRHVDHRWEYYFKEDEYLSVGVFYKQFDNPIEDVFQPAAGSLIKVPQNALRAENRGAEIESRFSLRRLNRELRRWSLVANYSWIQSEVELDPRRVANLTTRNRPLQGQSPYVVNIQLQYDRPAQGTQAALLYNVLGPRITEVGTDQRPDIYEQPFHQVDFVLNQKLSTNWQWQFRARNLLDPEVRATQGTEVVRATLRGRFYSMGATWTF